MFYYCAHCNYKSQAKSNVKRHQSFKHQSFKHNSTYDEVVEHPLLKQMDEKPMDLDLMEESIQVFKIFKLLQRMKDKWCNKLYEFVLFKYKLYTGIIVMLYFM